MNKSIQRVIALVVMLAVVMSATVYGASSFTIHYQELASDAPVVMTVNGDEIHSDEYAGYMEYNMAYYASMYAQMGISDLWNNAEAAAAFGPSMPDAAKEQATDTLTRNQQILADKIKAEANTEYEKETKPQMDPERAAEIERKKKIALQAALKAKAKQDKKRR